MSVNFCTVYKQNFPALKNTRESQGRVVGPAFLVLRKVQLWAMAMPLTMSGWFGGLGEWFSENP